MSNTPPSPVSRKGSQPNSAQLNEERGAGGRYSCFVTSVGFRFFLHMPEGGATPTLTAGARYSCLTNAMVVGGVHQK